MYTCVSDYACIIVRLAVSVYVCLNGSFKGSECGGLPFHRMSAVVEMWSTARPYIWNAEKIHQRYLLPLFSRPIFHRFVSECVFWVHVYVGVRVIVHHCVVLSAPDILKPFGPVSQVCAAFPDCR